jgi:hypothetical protein
MSKSPPCMCWGSSLQRQSVNPLGNRQVEQQSSELPKSDIDRRRRDHQQVAEAALLDGL